MPRLLIVLLVSLLSACATIRIAEDDLIHPDPKRDSIQEIAPGYRLDTIEIVHADGVASRGVWLRRDDSVATVVYFGGNEFHLDQGGTSVIKPLTAVQVDVVIVDHRGYGRSDGIPTVKLLQRDALDLVDHVRAGSPGRVVLYGHSLGSFIAAYAAAERDVDGLILEGTTTSVGEWAHNMVPWYAKPFVTLDVDPAFAEVGNTASLSRYTGPLLILVGSKDDQTPPKLARKLYRQAASTRKRFVVIPGQGHSAVVAGEAVAHAALAGFIAERPTGAP